MAPRQKAKPQNDPAPRQWPVENRKRWPIARLLPYARNPKTHPPAQIEAIARSMDVFGQAQLILIDGDPGSTQGEIIAGHGRVLAAEKLGWEEIEVAEARGWSEALKRAYRIADNELSSERIAPYDPSLLQMEVMDLRRVNFDVSLLGFPMIEMDGRMLVQNIETPSDFLNGLAVGEMIDEATSAVPTPRGVALKFDMLPADRDTVVEYLAAVRDKRKLRTAAEALIALAREGIRKR